MVEEGEPDPEFENILDTVDPNRSVPFQGVAFLRWYAVTATDSEGSQSALQ